MEVFCEMNKTTYKYILAIIIPCWNEEKLLPEMLNCLQKQTFEDWTAFCVDDLSTDRTAEIIKSYHVKDNRIQYVCRDREPKGGQTCRNIGVEKAKGYKYLTFFDADDVIAPYCLEQRVSFMEAHPDLDCGVFPVFAYIDDIHEVQGPVFGVKAFDDDLQAMIGFTVPFSTATNIYKYKSLIKYGLKWNDKIKSYQDVDFNIQFVLSGMKYSYASEAKADYFYHFSRDGVAGKIASKQHYGSHIYFIDKVTQSVSAKYGHKYDFYLEAMIVGFLGIFRDAWKPYLDLMRLPWGRNRWRFKLRIWFYMLILKKDRRIIFYKYRKYSKRQNVIWTNSVAQYRKELLAKGVEI